MQLFSSKTHTHTPGINCRRPGAAGRRATALAGEVSIVTAHWAEVTLIVELWLWILLLLHQDKLLILTASVQEGFIRFYSECSFALAGFQQKQLRGDMRKSWLWRFDLAGRETEKASLGPHSNKLQRTQNYAYSIQRESAAVRERVFNWGFIHLSCH